MHVYRCAACGHTFKTSDFAEKCPKCRCKILIHQAGERRRKKSCGCGGGSCASCGSSCSCH